MPDYKEMYFRLFRAAEKAINDLTEVQRECEELYVESPEPEIRIIDVDVKNSGDGE